MSSSLPCMSASLKRPRQAFLIFDRTERLVHVSSSTFALLGLPRTTTLLGERFIDLLRLATATSEDLDFVRNEMLADNLIKPGLHVRSVRLLTLADGRSLNLDLEPFGEDYRIADIEDVTIALEAEPVPGAMAYRDSLTGLGNRALFEQKLGERFAQQPSHELILLFLDLDRFKVVNDTLGHAVGDELLRLVSQRLQSTLRPSDILARMGGDEFAIQLAPPADKDTASTLAARILDLVQRTYLIDGHVVNVGASIGIAVAPQDGTSGDHVLKSADLALYYSKAAGRGVYHFFEPAMREKAERRRALELDLRKALVLRQFELHYQPQIDVTSQTITGLEALLRWRHPLRGLVLPDDFIGVAEEIGLVLPLGEWVLRTACREAMRWPGTVTVAVNVSALQFETGKFINSVNRALASTGLASGRLAIEVTEEILQRNSQTVLETLHKLRESGVRIVMGSFGTGLASLSRLVNFPFDKIKIDRAVIGMHQNNDVKSRAIVCAISALGHSLGIATLAEGVETPEQLTKVQSEGCQLVQGFYYSKALPANELLDFFANAFPAASPTSAFTTPEVTP